MIVCPGGRAAWTSVVHLSRVALAEVICIPHVGIRSISKCEPTSPQRQMTKRRYLVRDMIATWGGRCWGK
jgi:hypothetical protein